MKKCIYCNTPHRYSDNNGIRDCCMRCNFIVETLNSFVKAINLQIPLGENRPRRKLTIKSFVVEKI